MSMDAWHYQSTLEIEDSGTLIFTNHLRNALDRICENQNPSKPKQEIQ